jgi:L-ascorbate metabolism protein UlaG (beta-lactamase superfamily)
VRRWLKRGFAALGIILVLAVAAAVITGWRAFGKRARGERLSRMERSPQYRDGRFVNPQPLVNYLWGMVKGLLRASRFATPASLSVASVEPARLARPPASGLRVTWLGHAASLVEIDGARVLTDPVWSDRISPVPGVGPRRWYPPPVALGELPPIDVVVISHDHYDHLDHGTILAMRGWANVFVVPLGVGAHLAYWGIPEARIVELDWWEETRVAGLRIVCTPARHASGRHLFDRDATLWAGWALVGAEHRVYFSGDTGLFPAMKEIGRRLGPFDLTMIEVGQYHGSWPDWHIGPEQAVLAHRLVRGRSLLPIHWALVTLAYHGWTEPIERVLLAARAHGVDVLTPRPGQSVEPAAPPHERWWPEVPWETAAESPIHSTGVAGLDEN